MDNVDILNGRSALESDRLGLVEKRRELTNIRHGGSGELTFAFLKFYNLLVGPWLKKQDRNKFLIRDFN